MTGYTHGMKTAISIPDELFHQIDLCSRRLRVSRSRLMADAARQYLAQQRAPFDATAVWNEVIAKAGQPGDDPAAVALRRRNKRTLRVTQTKRG
jgi:predicted transcriptional regulator